MKPVTEVTGLIDVAAEQAALTQYLADRWDGVAGDLGRVVPAIYRHADSLAGAWFDEHCIRESLHRVEAARRHQLHAALTEGRHREIGSEFDSLVRQFWRIGQGLSALEKAGRSLRCDSASWDFEREAQHLTNRIHTAFSWTRKVRPKGWSAVKSSKDEFSGIDGWDEAADQKSFDGHDLAGVVSHNLVHATAPRHVRYSDVAQGRPPELTFISAIFSHFLCLVTHNNTAAMRAELDSIVLLTLSDHALFAPLPDQVLFDRQIGFNHALLMALDLSATVLESEDARFAGTYTQERFEQLLNEPASDQEAVTNDELDGFNRDLIEEIRAEEADGTAARRLAHEKAIYRKTLLSVLDSVEPAGSPELDA